MDIIVYIKIILYAHMHAIIMLYKHTDYTLNEWKQYITTF